MVATLHDEGVRHVVIGGVAVAAHGFVRATAEVDLVPDPGPENLRALGNALVRLDARLPLAGGRPFAHDEHGPVLRQGGNLTLDTADGGLDIVQRAPGSPASRRSTLPPCPPRSSARRSGSAPSSIYGR